MEKQSVASCPVLGGKRMVLSGHNFLQDSKVIFVEKAPGTSPDTAASVPPAGGAAGGLGAEAGGPRVQARVGRAWGHISAHEFVPTQG